jgi:lipoprotein-anchoring transpeptidase ErfK/SrfK
MRKQTKDFLAKTVDEQVEQLLRTEDSTSAGSVVQDLQGLYEQIDTPEQVHHSLDAIWSRLADRISPEMQTMFSMPEGGSLHVLPHEGDEKTLVPFVRQNNREQLGEESEITIPLMRPASRRSSKHNVRRTLALSVLAAIVLLSIFSWTLVAHLNSQGRSNLGSGPGTPMPTVPSTPAPQSLREQTQHLLSQFHQEVTIWGQAHQYQDPSNGQTYELDYAYDHQGIGGLLDQSVAQAKSTADYQAALNQIQLELTNLHVMESNSADQTPWNQAHSADMSLLDQYQLKTGSVVVVSLLEQSMRVYQNGQLTKAFQVTTGRYEAPSLPGSWQITQRLHNTTLKSAYPKGSPNWFPPTPIQYALIYHPGGYMFLGSWWRESYGMGTNFSHHDSSGNPTANNGSQGSVELANAYVAWLYNNLQVNTPVVIY